MKNNSVKRMTAGLVAAAVVVAGSIPVSLVAPTVTAQAEGNTTQLTTGSCGKDAKGNLSDNVTYSFDNSTGTLTISGKGEMKDYVILWEYKPF